MTDKIKIAQGFNFMERCPTCGETKCRMVSHATDYSSGVVCYVYQFECTKGHVFRKRYNK